MSAPRSTRLRARARRRRPGRTAGALVAALALALGACASAGRAEPGPMHLGAAEVVPPQLEPALDALRIAVESRDDPLARRILARVMSRNPSGRALELALGFARVLDGRDVLRSLELALETRPLDGAPLAYRLVLVARHDRPEPLVLRTLPPSLERIVDGVSPDGVGSRQMTSDVADELDELRIPPAGLEVELGTYVVPLFGKLAVRDRWRLATRSGEVVVGGESYPAAAPEVADWEREYIAPMLPLAPVEPGELVRYARQDEISTPALMERAVRIRPERRIEALVAMEPVVREVSEERALQLVPALRWLARGNRPGADVDAWRRTLRRVVELGAEEDAAAELDPALDLPDVGGGGLDPGGTDR